MTAVFRSGMLAAIAAAALSGLVPGAGVGLSPTPAPFPVASPGPGGATNLVLAPGLSFTDDSSSNFPIRGADLVDGRIASDRPTVIFFGTSHCWNTNREAERFVRLYARHREEARFLVVDLDAMPADQKILAGRLFHGYIPTVAFLDRSGEVVSDRSGESARERGDVAALEDLLKQSR
jgi:hypothetical protein